MGEAYVTIQELAEEFGRSRSGVRRWILKHPMLKDEVKLLRVRPPGTANANPSLALSLQDAELVRQAREEDGFGANECAASGIVTSSISGWFYVVQPIPEFDQNRIKLGFAVDTRQRLATYRSICPSAEILKAWPCKATWERTAIASISREGCSSLGQELFQCDDVAAMIDRADAFFKLMPS
jgi:hypothetical protein